MSDLTRPLLVGLLKNSSMSALRHLSPKNDSIRVEKTIPVGNGDLFVYLPDHRGAAFGARQPRVPNRRGKS
jgi:hypothetical protein